MGLLVLAVSWPVHAATDPADDLPAAAVVDKVTWSTSPGSTRIEFHGRGLVAPAVAHPSEGVLRVDFTAADAPAVPHRLQVGTDEVKEMTRIPGSTGGLPDGVSERWLLRLARTDVAWRVDTQAGAIALLVGDVDKVGVFVGTERDASWLANPAAARVDEQRPETAELFPRPLGIALPVDAELRATPSALASRVGTLPAGEKRLADARRGDWVHVATGGWLRLPEGRVPESESAAGGSAPARTPMAWGVVTLGTGLDLRVEEAMPGDPQAAAVGRLYAGPVQLARFRVAVDPDTGYSFRLPSKKARVVLDLPEGGHVESLDPTSLPLRDPTSRARLDLAMAAPDLAPGSTWSTWLVFPADLDFLKVEGAQVDVDGRLHRLFRVPGSGEAAP